MTTNQTIDGVPRELLESIALNLSDDPAFYVDPMMADYALKLRALLDAADHVHEWDINAEGTATVCRCGARSSDFPAEMQQTITVSPVARSLLVTIKQLENTIERQMAVLSKTEELLDDMLRDDEMKAHWFGDRINACLKDVIHMNDIYYHFDAQPQGEPVAKCSGCNGKGSVCIDWDCGEWMDCPDCKAPADAEGYPDDPPGTIYGDEHPAPVAVGRPVHANQPPGTEPCGTHHDNDGLDEMRKLK